MKKETLLETLGNLAQILESTDFRDNFSVVQKRAFRSGADTFLQSFEEMAGVPVTPPSLLGMWLGATAQVVISRNSNPLAAILEKVTKKDSVDNDLPDTALMITFGYIARDLLAGERVE